MLHTAHEGNQPKPDATERSQFDRDGFTQIESALDAAECAALADVASEAAGEGARNLLSLAWCATLAEKLRNGAAIGQHIPSTHDAVQCTFFQKSQGHNWLVPFHQDVSIPVAERVAEPSLSGWSQKDGVLFVHAPLEVLEQLVAVRLHLDVCREGDGPLRVIPATHRMGRLSSDTCMTLRKQLAEVVCAAECGDALVLRPLTLHASSKANGRSQRRVLHFLFGPATLPFGLRWAGADEGHPRIVLA
jgi:hypothetical protein